MQLNQLVATASQNRATAVARRTSGCRALGRLAAQGGFRGSASRTIRPCPPRLLRTVCNRDCPDACGLIATVEDGRLVRLGGDPDHPGHEGLPLLPDLAVPGPPELARPADDAAPARRLRVPRGLVGGGARLRRRPAPRDPRRVGPGRDPPLPLRAAPSVSSRASSTTSSSSSARSPSSAATSAREPATPRRRPTSATRSRTTSSTFANSKGILLWGKNPFVSNVHLLPLLKEAKAGGARLVLIDPVRHKTASLADAYVAPRPGGDLALALGVAALLFETGRVVPEAASFCEGFDAFRALALSKTPAGLGARTPDVAHGHARAPRVDALRPPLQHPGRLGHGPPDERLGDRPRPRRPRRPDREPRHPGWRRQLLLQAARRASTRRS